MLDAGQSALDVRAAGIPTDPAVPRHGEIQQRVPVQHGQYVVRVEGIVEFWAGSAETQRRGATGVVAAFGGRGGLLLARLFASGHVYGAEV